MNTRYSWYALVAASTAAIGAVAHCDITVDYDGTGAGLRQDVSFTGQSWDETGDETFYNVGAFERLWTSEGGDSLTTWCIEIFQGLTLGETVTFDIVDPTEAPGAGPPNPGPMTAGEAAVLSDVFARWIDPSTGGIGGDAETADARAAAFQLVVWEITHENFSATDRDGVAGQIDLGMGGLQAALTGDDDVAFWVNEIVGSIGEEGWLESELLGLINDEAQDQIILVPAPGALALLGLGSFAAVRRRRRA